MQKHAKPLSGYLTIEDESRINKMRRKFLNIKLKGERPQKEN